MSGPCSMPTTTPHVSTLHILSHKPGWNTESRQQLTFDGQSFRLCTYPFMKRKKERNMHIFHLQRIPCMMTLDDGNTLPRRGTPRNTRKMN